MTPEICQVTYNTEDTIVTHTKVRWYRRCRQIKILKPAPWCVLLIFATSVLQNTHADEPLSCSLGLLKDLGWDVRQSSTSTEIENAKTCEHELTPVFNFNPAVERRNKILERSESALRSISSRCLVSRQYKKSIKASIGRLVKNEKFKFPTKGRDPRDPFIPPVQSWVAAGFRGYDIPAESLSQGINALYTQPFVAECAAAAQIAQLALFTEHYGVFTDAMLQPRDVGIGIWPEYIKNPSIAEKSALLINSKKRKHALRELAALGKGAFYGQSGYIKPYQNISYIDSLDNRGQNFVIVDITERAVTSIQNRKKPLKEINKISKNIWKQYKKRLDAGSDKDELVIAMKNELEALDPFFSEINIYVHPLSVKNIAHHVARQFKWNPRTPFVFELYEDYQSGYFYNRYLDYRLKQCQQQSYCRRIDRKHVVRTGKSGLPDPQNFTSMRQCKAAL